MPALFVFLFKVNLALLLFCAGYYLVLRPLTFYTLNRAYLIAAILFASVYPYIDLTGFMQRHENLAKPMQTVIYRWQVPAEQLMKPLSEPDYWRWATVLFWAGVVLLGIRFLMQLFSLYMLYRNSKPQRIHNHDVRIINGEAAPFSFWKSIYVNPANHTDSDLKAILQHEQIHVNGWHTLDILLAELSAIFYWFNPGIWLMKKAVRENIEFITDRKILNNGIDSKSYQYSLVNVSFNNNTPGIVNHFNISTIKKRIIMMNAKRSSRYNLTRYAFVLPVVVGLLLVFTISKADVAKPFRIRFANAIKPVTVALKEAAKSATVALRDTVPAKQAKANTLYIITKDDTAKRKTIRSITFRQDTSKHGMLFLTNNAHSLDSLNVVVDGKKVSQSQFQSVDPTKIASINIISAADAKRLGEDFGFTNDKKIAVVVTSNSEAGKQLALKLKQEQPITKITINDIAKDPANLSDKDAATIAALPGLEGKIKGKVTDVRIIRRGDAKTPAELKEIVVNGYPSHSVTFKADSAVFVEDQSLKKNTIYFKADPKVGSAGVAGISYYPRTFTITTDNFNRISDKAIVIDGKVATEKEMKKLSAFDIDKVNVIHNVSQDTIQKYGDKAKQGVVYITTKKPKK